MISSRSPDELLKFIEDSGRSFLPAYIPIMKRRKDMEYTPEQKEWQQIRRGRYVEFNLVCCGAQMFVTKSFISLFSSVRFTTAEPNSAWRRPVQELNRFSCRCR